MTAVGIALLVIGIAMIIAEAHLDTHGIIGAVGVVALAASGLLLFNTDSSEFEVSAPAVIAVAVVLGGGLAFAVSKAVAGGQSAGADGSRASASASPARSAVPLSPIGQVFVDGALWRASLADDAAEADAERVRERGARVRVEAVEGLTLRVRPLAEVDADAEEGVRS